MQTLNITDLIENYPITKLSSINNDKFINKIINKFTNYEQQLFLSEFYCYLNYNKKSDFVIDLDDIWKWIGYSSKYNSERVIEKHFIENIDYKLIDNPVLNTNTESTRGGHNIKKIYLTINCFKSLCLKAQTKKAVEIHDYYIKLEELLLETLEEETNELKQQLMNKDTIIINIEKEKQTAIEETIVKHFPVNTECIYIGTISNTNESNEKLIKFGHSNNLSVRIKEHKKNYNNFILIDAFKVQNKVEIENLIKINKFIKPHIRNIIVNNKNKTEIIAYDDNFTIDKIKKIINDIIIFKSYSVENFNKLLRENSEYEIKCKNYELEIDDKNILINDLRIKLSELETELNDKNILLKNAEIEQQSVYENPLLEDDNENTVKFNKFIDDMCIIRQDVEESSANLEGQFRIWNKLKPKKTVFHEFKSYLDTRFKPIRMKIQNQNNVAYGYQGIKLIPIEYKKKYASPLNVETFLFQVCKFSPNGKILNSTLIGEYNKWKNLMNIETTNNEISELKTYLNSCEYVIKSTVWTNDGSNEGYYGIMLKSDEFNIRKTSSTGKAIEKVEIKSNIVLCQWETIAKAAVFENISTAKLSRYIKNNVIIDSDYLYREKLK